MSSDGGHKAGKALPVWVRPSTPPQPSGAEDAPDWWSVSHLVLKNERADRKPRQIGHGSLAEMIAQALSRPLSERGRLYIETDLGATKLNWHEIVALAARSDCPVII